jgi:hypothetical protein
METYNFAARGRKGSRKIKIDRELVTRPEKAHLKGPSSGFKRHQKGRGVTIIIEPPRADDPSIGGTP